MMMIIITVIMINITVITTTANLQRNSQVPQLCTPDNAPTVLTSQTLP
jgi:hypothetical protein